MTADQTTQKASAHRLSRIRLELARSKDRVEGSQGEGYEFVAPLDPTGHISVDGWKHDRALCFVHRFEGGVTVQRGLLMHRPGGPGGATWAFDYEGDVGIDEEAGYRFGAHAFAVGEYVSVRDADGELRTYRVAQVRPA